MKDKYPFIESYFNNWPVYMLMRQFLNNHCANEHAKMTKAAAANTSHSTVGPGPDLDGAEGDNNQNENYEGILWTKFTTYSVLRDFN